MYIYIALICYVIILPIIISGLNITSDRKKKEAIILALSLIAVFLIFALKKETVGIDIAGYKAQYELSRYKDWLDVDYVYFENGYITLMKVFSKLGISFQLYTAVIYGFICCSLYFFIKTYSSNVTLSVLVFICYQFFLFDLSGIRQAIAMSICLFSFLILDKRKHIIEIVSSAFLIILAITIHQSALIFFLVYFVKLFHKTKIHTWIYLFILVISSFLRSYIWNFVNLFMREVDTSTAITLGGNFIFLCGITVFMLFTIYFYNKEGKAGYISKGKSQKYRFDILTIKIMLLSLSANIIFSGNSMLRATSYLTLFLIPGLPNFIKYYSYKSRFIMNAVVGIFLIFLFYIETLRPNQLNICPYLFFWQ